MLLVPAVHVLLNKCGQYLVFSFFVLEVLLYVYKSYYLHFGSSACVEELFILFGWLVSEVAKHFFGSLIFDPNGISKPAYISTLVFYIPSALGGTFFLFWQSFVTQIEVVTCSTLLCFNCLQFIISLVVIIPNRKNPN